MKNELPKGYEISVSGPFTEYSSPFGRVLDSMNRHIWYVSRKLTPKELKKASEIGKILKTTSLGVISRFDAIPNRYVIRNLFPYVSFNSLSKAVNFLIKNEGKLVFCS